MHTRRHRDEHAIHTDRAGCRSRAPSDGAGSLRLVRRPGLHRRRGQRQRAAVLRPPRSQVRREAPRDRDELARRDRRLLESSDSVARQYSAARAARPAAAISSPIVPIASARSVADCRLRRRRSMTSSPTQSLRPALDDALEASTCSSSRGPAGVDTVTRPASVDGSPWSDSDADRARCSLVDATTGARARRSGRMPRSASPARRRAGCRRRTRRPAPGRGGTPAARTRRHWRRGDVIAGRAPPLRGIHRCVEQRSRRRRPRRRRPRR